MYAFIFVLAIIAVANAFTPMAGRQSYGVSNSKLMSVEKFYENTYPYYGSPYVKAKKAAEEAAALAAAAAAAAKKSAPSSSGVSTRF